MCYEKEDKLFQRLHKENAQKSCKLREAAKKICRLSEFLQQIIKNVKNFFSLNGKCFAPPPPPLNGTAIKKERNLRLPVLRKSIGFRAIVRNIQITIRQTNA